MLSVIIACDKFKGSMTALEACTSLQNGILFSNIKDIKCQIQPMADGGEGTLEILFSHLLLQEVKVIVQDPLGRSISARYGFKDDIAYIETAASCGLQLLATHERNPLFTNTYGVGQMISDAMNRGLKSIHLFVGGSATSDGGVGMAAALGFKFLDKNGQSFIPNGSTLTQIKSVEFENKHPLINKVSFYIWTDVKIPLFGKSGSAYLFAKQKGASEKELEILDIGLRHLESIYYNISTNQKITFLREAGAAGGLAAGCMVFLNAKLGSGINFIIEQTNLPKKIKEADIIITGEGSIDDQSTSGKVISGIAEVCRHYNKPLILIGGTISLSVENNKLLSPFKTYCIKKEQMSLEYAIQNGSKLLYEIGKDVGDEIFQSDFQHIHKK